MATQNSKAQPVLVAASILATLTAISGALSAVILDNVFVVIFAVIVAGLNVGIGVYVKGQVVPYVDTAAYVNDSGNVVAGPAALQPNGVSVAVIPD